MVKTTSAHTENKTFKQHYSSRDTIPLKEKKMQMNWRFVNPHSPLRLNRINISQLLRWISPPIVVNQHDWHIPVKNYAECTVIQSIAKLPYNPIMSALFYCLACVLLKKFSAQYWACLKSVIWISDVNGWVPEIIEWMVEDQAFLRSYDSAPRPPPSPYSPASASCLSFSVFLWVAGRSYLQYMRVSD
jgi:hypothetical protein